MQRVQPQTTVGSKSSARVCRKRAWQPPECSTHDGMTKIDTIQTSKHPPAILQCFPGTRVEAPANPELYWSGKDPLQELIQRETQQVGFEEGFTAWHHGQHHGQHEDRQGECTAVPQQPPPVLQLCSAIIRSKCSAGNRTHLRYKRFYCG